MEVVTLMVLVRLAGTPAPSLDNGACVQEVVAPAVPKGACWPRMERRCVWHRGAQTTLCFDIKVGCQNELASG